MFFCSYHEFDVIHSLCFSYFFFRVLSFSQRAATVLIIIMSCFRNAFAPTLAFVRVRNPSLLLP